MRDCNAPNFIAPVLILKRRASNPKSQIPNRRYEVIALSNIKVQFGERILFEDLSLHVGRRDRIGLVGSNGAGKSTLLKIIAGMEEPHQGTMSMAKHASVGYLPQDVSDFKGRSLFAEVETAFDSVLHLQQELEEIRRQLEVLDHASEEFQDALELFGELQHQLEASEAYRMKSEIEKVLMGLGFESRDFNRMTEEFSGGWQMRIALSKLLLRNPTVLLLDEPTNQLDIESLQWLEEYLQAYRGSVILVSHDRAFLNNLTTRTWELSGGSTTGKLTECAGNYDFYVEEKELRKEQRVAALKNQQEKIKQTQEFIDRFRSKATKARQVQSRIKQLEKMDVVEIEEEEDHIIFNFPPAPSSGRIVLELKSASKSYGEQEVLKAFDLVIGRGEKIVLLGVNGAGKSTLAKILAGVEPLTSGERSVGYNVRTSYFAQHQAEELEPNKTPLEILDEVATGEIRKKLRTILGSFLFSGDDAFKKVSVLSGGEKSRLALAKMLLQPANVLILDEPTNHLDMRSKEILQVALLRYDGTVVLVSHDRDFVDPIVSKCIEVKQHSLRMYPGNVSQFLWKKKQQQMERGNTAAITIDTKSARPPEAVPAHSERERRRVEAELRQQKSRQTKPIKSEIDKVEVEIEELEKTQMELEAALANPDEYKDADRAKELNAEYRRVSGELSAKMKRWEDLQSRLMEIEKEFTGER